jgi:hypothetical protein
MKKKLPPILDELIEPLTQCLTEEVARKIASLKPSRRLQARVRKLSEKTSAGTLTEDERIEYGQYVAYGTFVSTLKANARLRLARSRDDK